MSDDEGLWDYGDDGGTEVEDSEDSDDDGDSGQLDPETLLPADRKRYLDTMFYKGRNHGRNVEIDEDDVSGPTRRHTRQRGEDVVVLDDEDEALLDGEYDVLQGLHGIDSGRRESVERVADKEVDDAKRWLQKCEAGVEEESEEEESEESEQEEEAFRIETKIDRKNNGNTSERNGVEASTSGVHGEEEEDKAAIQLRFVDKNKQELQLFMRLNDTFEFSFHKYKTHAVAQGWTSDDQQCIFMFDGEEIMENQTPEELDMEDRDIVDVYYKRG